MPRVPAHLVKSAIRLERQSTTVPNTSNTSAFTAEISDMFDPFQTSSFRDGPKDQTRNLEIPGSLATLAPRNDGGSGALIEIEARPATERQLGTPRLERIIRKG